MKDLKVTKEVVETFTPIKVEFTIECENELRELWCRLNKSSNFINNSSYPGDRFRGTHFHDLWVKLDNLRK